jgi:hypothetical protein
VKAHHAAASQSLPPWEAPRRDDGVSLGVRFFRFF